MAKTTKRAWYLHTAFTELVQRCVALSAEGKKDREVATAIVEEYKELLHEYGKDNFTFEVVRRILADKQIYGARVSRRKWTEAELKERIVLGLNIGQRTYPEVVEEGVYPAIVTKEEFEHMRSVKEAIAKKRTDMFNNILVGKRKGQSLVCCAMCGAVMTPRVYTDLKYKLLNCNKRARHGVDTCNNKAVKYEQVVYALMKFIHENNFNTIDSDELQVLRDEAATLRSQINGIMDNLHNLTGELQNTATASMQEKQEKLSALDKKITVSLVKLEEGGADDWYKQDLSTKEKRKQINAIFLKYFDKVEVNGHMLDMIVNLTNGEKHRVYIEDLDSDLVARMKY
ncbi:recombinase zinc beta ribbon domain-containing protein [Vibrio harveyi]|uniref:recombinase zinc beta ribbon domain-containing protein n=1 Tax=Vibrio harveyi TaxID=669 RepID=UPI0018F159BB|nr:recombinase zinc beta ribbon domain-containing protein [Vibrio harveyi]